MNKKNEEITRRHFLKAAGATLSLPLLESLLPARALAAPFPRFLVVNFPNGAGNIWQPSGSGGSYSFGDPALDGVLGPYRNMITLFQNLNSANAGGSPAHASAAVAFLTGLPLGSMNSPSVGGVSADQLIAKLIGTSNQYESLHLGPEPYSSGNPQDTGWPTIYNCNISWETRTKPAAQYTDPNRVFQLLGGGSAPPPPSADDKKRSVLDYVLDQTARLKNRVSSGDKQKLDEYMTSLRQVESTLAQPGGGGNGGGTCGATNPNPGGNFAHDAHTNKMLDLIPLLFSCDLTRVITYQMDYEFGNKDFSALVGGNRELHHNLTHTPNVVDKVNRIGVWHAEKLARLLGKLQNTTDPNGGTLLDNTVILFGTGMNAVNGGHSRQNIPMLLAGGGAGLFNPGRIVNAGGRSHADVLRALLEKFGHNLSANPFAGSSTVLSGL